MSFSFGTLVMVLGFSDRMLANKIGSAAFFAPEINTSPCKGPLAVTRNCCILCLTQVGLKVFLCAIVPA